MLKLPSAHILQAAKVNIDGTDIDRLDCKVIWDLLGWLSELSRDD